MIIHPVVHNGKVLLNFDSLLLLYITFLYITCQALCVLGETCVDLLRRRVSKEVLPKLSASLALRVHWATLSYNIKIEAATFVKSGWIWVRTTFSYSNFAEFVTKKSCLCAESVFQRNGSVGIVMFYITNISHSTTEKVLLMFFKAIPLQPMYYWSGRSKLHQYTRYFLMRYSILVFICVYSQLEIIYLSGFLFFGSSHSASSEASKLLLWGRKLHSVSRKNRDFNQH